MPLGDLGSGKTHVFRSAAAAAAGGGYLTVRTFLNAPPDYSGDTIIIDALDEKRLSRGDDDVVDAIVQKLVSNPPSEGAHLVPRTGLARRFGPRGFPATFRQLWRSDCGQPVSPIGASTESARRRLACFSRMSMNMVFRVFHF